MVGKRGIRWLALLAAPVGAVLILFGYLIGPPYGFALYGLSAILLVLALVLGLVYVPGGDGG